MSTTNLLENAGVIGAGDVKQKEKQLKLKKNAPTKHSLQARQLAGIEVALNGPVYS